MEQVSDSKRYWVAVNSFKRKSKNKVGTISTHKWVNHFQTLLNPPLLAEAINFVEPYILNENLDSQFRMDELKAVLNKVKNGKAPGFDRVPYEVFKNAPTTFLQNLLSVYNNIYNKGVEPESFKKSIVFPLFKKGDVNSVDNYRGLSFIDCIGKFFTSLLNSRCFNWVNSEGLLTEYQAGFRQGYSTVDNIFNLASMVHLRLNENRGKLYSFFVDFSSAFDTIDRKALMFKLSGMGMSTKMLTTLKKLF